MVVEHNDHLIMHIVVNGFPNRGLELRGDRIVLRDSYVGTDATGTFAVPNALECLAH